MESVSVSKKSLLTNGIIAIVAAAIILIAVVLPAEYDIDPVGLGKLLGLTDLQTTDLAQSSDTSDAAAIDLSTMAVSNSHAQAAMDEVIEIHLKPLDEVEYKATLPKGEPLLYSWSVSRGDVYYDFHGEPYESEEFEEGYFEQYEQGEVTTAHGSFLAPFSGHHGWYWLNYNDFDVTIRLHVQGYYGEVVELFRNNQAEAYQ